MDLAIAVPCGQMVHAGFARCLANLTRYLADQQYDFEVVMVMGSVLPQQRTDLVKHAAAKQARWILWLDSDMHFPDTVFDRMLAWNKTIVACTYSTRMKPQQSVAFTNSEDLTERLTADQGLHPVWAVGMGCMLTKTEIFSQIPQPWFSHQWHENSQSYTGEDLYFCDRAQTHGHGVYVDCDLSKEIAHYGTKAYLLREV